MLMRIVWAGGSPATERSTLAIPVSHRSAELEDARALMFKELAVGHAEQPDLGSRGRSHHGVWFDGAAIAILIAAAITINLVFAAITGSVCRCCWSASIDRPARIGAADHRHRRGRLPVVSWPCHFVSL